MVCAYTASIVNLKETRKQVINYLAQLMTPSRSVSPSWCARKRGIIVPAHPETNPCSFYAIFFLTMVLVQKRCVLHGVGELIVCIRWLRTCIFRKKVMIWWKKEWRATQCFCVFVSDEVTEKGKESWRRVLCRACLLYLFFYVNLLISLRSDY